MNRCITILICAFLLLWQARLGAHAFSWAQLSGGQGAKCGRAMVQDQNMNLYVCGNLEGTALFGSTTLSDTGSFVAMYNSAGSAVWAVALHGINCTGIGLGKKGRVCIGGYFYDSVQLGSFKLKSVGKADFFMATLSSSGQVLQANSGGGPGNDYALTLANDVTGNIYIAGSFEDYINFDQVNSLLSLGKSDAFIAQYDTGGHFQWCASGGGSSADAATAVGADVYGNVYMTGYFNGSATFHNNTVKSKGGADIFLAKFNSQGYQLYVDTYGGADDDIPSQIAFDGSSNLYMTGTFGGTSSFGVRSITSAGGNDAFVAAINNNRGINWIRDIGGAGNDAGGGIYTDWASNVFVTGSFAGSITIGNTSLNSAGNADIFVIKYDAAGRVLWAAGAGGAGSDSAFAITADQNDAPYISGTLEDKVSLGNIAVDADSSGSFFIAQLVPALTGIAPMVAALAQVSVYPNPSNGIFRVSGLEASDGPFEIWVTDVQGRRIDNIKLPSLSGGYLLIDLGSQPAGVYFVTIRSATGSSTQKLVRESF